MRQKHLASTILVLSLVGLGCGDNTRRTSSECTDADYDGYPREQECGEVDCNDSDAGIHPHAEELCGNEVDDDCDSQIDRLDCSCCPDCDVCCDADGDGYGVLYGDSPQSGPCPHPEVDCDDDATDDESCPTVENLETCVPGCTCGSPDCVCCAGCIHPGVEETPNDGIDSDCDGQDSIPCFIATACFGTEMSGKIDVLRNFRDRCLGSSEEGRGLVEAYYRISPPIADYIAEREWLRTLVRTLLLPLVGFVWILV